MRPTISGWKRLPSGRHEWHVSVATTFYYGFPLCWESVAEGEVDTQEEADECIADALRKLREAA